MPRLSKLIADAGIASRRKAADLIRAGRVRVDGEAITSPGVQVDPTTSRVEVDGRLVAAEERVYLLLNKPADSLSTVVDQRGRRTVVDLVGGVEQRVYPAGRLDADTEGLLLLTNDGELTFRLTHPRYGVEKVYEAEVKGRPSGAALRRLEEGVMLEDGVARAVRARLLEGGGEGSRVEVVLHSGRKRQVRRMLKAVGHPVLRLRRTRLGSLTLGSLQVGEWRALTVAEIEGLRTATEENAAP